MLYTELESMSLQSLEHTGAAELSAGWQPGALCTIIRFHTPTHSPWINSLWDVTHLLTRLNSTLAYHWLRTLTISNLAGLFSYCIQCKFGVFSALPLSCCRMKHWLFQNWIFSFFVYKKQINKPMKFWVCFLV